MFHDSCCVTTTTTTTAYFPDGDHDGKDELETTISQTGSSCADTFSCPHPRYMKDGVFLGVDGTADFGLDVYEPEFFTMLLDWAKAGQYMIELKFDDASYTKDLFYFCHVSIYRERVTCGFSVAPGIVGVGGHFASKKNDQSLTWLVLLNNIINNDNGNKTDPPIHVGSHQAL